MLGFTQTQRVVLFTEDDPLRLAGGERLEHVEVAYETYGTLNDGRDNAVFVCHALTGDAHAAGHHGDPRRRGWWDNLIGPGKALDTDRFFVICPNLLGGCQGTTGPASVDPRSGEPYGLGFPMLQMSDFVAVHRRLLEHLGIDRLHAAVGGSLGGMQVLQWAVDAPEQVENAVVVAASSRLTAQNIAFSAVAREVIMRDPDFADGRYVGTDRSPRLGLAVARMMAHITYLSEAAMSEKFGRRLQVEGDGRDLGDAGDTGARMGFGVDFQVESYLNHQGQVFLDRFDALSYLYLTRVMDYFDPFADTRAADRVAEGGTRFLVLSFDSDWRFDTSHSRRIVRLLERAGVPVTFREIASPWGHDSFLLEVPGYHDTVAAFLAGAPTAAVPAAALPTAGAPTAAVPGRPDLDVVSGLVPDGARVLDLGCGHGLLLSHLMQTRGCRGTGVEIDPDAVLAAARRGVPVIELDIDRQLGEFTDEGYDVVVLSRTLQATHRPAEVLRQISRIGRSVVLSVPNFGLWRHRVSVLRGHMPVSRDLPYPWHETPNIHLSTLADMEQLFEHTGLAIRTRVLLDESGAPMTGNRWGNLRAAGAVYLLTASG